VDFATRRVLFLAAHGIERIRNVSHKNLNPVNGKSPKRVAIVLSNPDVSPVTGWPVGFWWSELTHPYFKFREIGYEVEICSPEGGLCEADQLSDPEDPSEWQAEDVISRGYKHDPAFAKGLEDTSKVDEILVDDFDAIVVTGGMGPIYKFGPFQEVATARFPEIS
jgi:putative intracellular protease/amidase